MGNPQLACDTCNVVTTSEGQLAVHIDGKKHKRLTAIADLQSLQGKEEGQKDDSGETISCDLCNVEAPSPLHHQYHLRGQRHQRREKQLQLMDASEQIAQASVVSLLNDSSLQIESSRSESPANKDLSSGLHRDIADEQSSEYGSASSSPIISSSNSVEDRESNEKGSWRETTSINGFSGSRLDMQSEDVDEVDQLRDAEECKTIPDKGSQDEVQCTVSVPLVSPFEELATAEDQGNVLAVQEILDDGQDPTPEDESRQIPTVVSGNEGTEDIYQGISMADANMLGAGGSFSSPSLHFCSACGVKATSHANLQDHLQGRKHTRRIQYLSRQPPGVDVTFALPNTAGHMPSQFGQYTLPTSMDFSSHLGRAARAQASPHARLTERVGPFSSFRSMHSRHFSFDSARGLYNRESAKTVDQFEPTKSSESFSTPTKKPQDSKPDLKGDTNLQKSDSPQETQAPALLQESQTSEKQTPSPVQAPPKMEGESVQLSKNEVAALGPKTPTLANDVPSNPGDSPQSSNQKEIQKSNRQSPGYPRHHQRTSRPGQLAQPVLPHQWVNGDLAHSLDHIAYGPYPPYLPPNMISPQAQQGWNIAYPQPYYPMMYPPGPHLMMAPGGYMFPQQFQHMPNGSVYMDSQQHSEGQRQYFASEMQSQDPRGSRQILYNVNGRQGEAPHAEGKQSQPGNPYNCELCSVETNELALLEQHIRGKRHKRRLQALAKPSN